MNPINEWFCRVLCIGHVLLKVFRRYPHLSVMSLPYVTDMEHEYPYPHETGPTGQLTGQLSNSIVASRFGHVSICSMQPRLKVQAFVVTLTEQPFSCMASKEQVLGYLATHTA
jgi:hypothetical protein